MFKGPEVTLEEVLSNRERRAERVSSFLSSFPSAVLVTLSVNLMGPVKNCEESLFLFEKGLSLFDSSFKLLYEDRGKKTGPEAMLLSPYPPEETKRICLSVEDGAPWGRMLDADVHSSASQLSRSELGRPERGCIVCGAPGRSCASRRLHTLDEMYRAVERLCREARQNG